MKDNFGAKKGDLERGYSVETTGVPPKTIKDEFGERPNHERMGYDEESGEYKDTYCGGFLQRHTNGDEDDC